MFLCYDSDSWFPEYSRSFTYAEVKKHKHLPHRDDYVIKECVIEVHDGLLIYCFTYSHIDQYKKCI